LIDWLIEKVTFETYRVSFNALARSDP